MNDQNHSSAANSARVAALGTSAAGASPVASGGSATLFDGRHLAGRASRVEVIGGELLVESKAEKLRYALSEVRVTVSLSSRYAAKSARARNCGTAVHPLPERLVALPDGGQLHCADGAWLDAVPNVSRIHARVAWLERRPLSALVSSLLLIGMALALYFIGIPRAGDLAAARIGAERERAIGRQNLSQFDFLGFPASELPAAQRALTLRKFEELARGLPTGREARLVFKGGKSANAFAFVGGTVVVTDALFSACSLDEVVAILAHELGHVAHRHPLRSLFRDSAASALLAALSGDIGDVGISPDVLRGSLARSRYSREFESEADAFGFQLLRAHGYSPALFADCLERISVPSSAFSLTELVATHPSTADRVARARAAARQP